MTDAKFDFQVNDIVISNGDVELVSLCSQQNATLIFSKSAASWRRRVSMERISASRG